MRKDVILYYTLRYVCYSVTGVTGVTKCVCWKTVYICSDRYMRKDVPNFFFTFSFRFVTLIYTPIRIHCCSFNIVLDTEMQALSLKLPLLHLFRSLYEKRCPQFFFNFFVSFRYIDLYRHQNPLLLLLHSAGHRDAGLIIETPFVTFVPIVIWEKMSPIFF